MGTTANYSWPYPESSDYVADGATAIENLADAADLTVKSIQDDVAAIGVNTGWTVNFRPGTGTWTTVFGFSSFYWEVGNTVFGLARLYIGNAGTGANTVLFDLPTTADTAVLGIGNGRESALTGNQFHVYLVNSTTGGLRFYNNGDTANNAYDLHFNFFYKKP